LAAFVAGLLLGFGFFAGFWAGFFALGAAEALAGLFLTGATGAFARAGGFS
jgi:hypothetical protein